MRLGGGGGGTPNQKLGCIANYCTNIGDIAVFRYMTVCPLSEHTQVKANVLMATYKLSTPKRNQYVTVSHKKAYCVACCTHCFQT
jgi:hypothetical protein